MSTGHDAVDAVMQGVHTQPSDSLLGDEGEGHVEVPPEISQGGLTGVRDAESFKHIWQLFGYTVLDDAGTKVGRVARIWTDTASGQLKFVGLTTGWLRRQTHVIPARDARIDDRNRTVAVQYPAATIRNAPHHNTDVSLNSDKERKVDTYYDNN